MRNGAMSSPSTPTELGRKVPTSTAEVSGDLRSGSSAGEYVIDALIARGGCGAVYAARHRVLSRRAAIKVLHPEFRSSTEMLQRFLREARTVNQIRHANIVDIYDFGQ